MTEELTKGMATQKKIVDAAYALFVEQGYHGTSMRQISEKAGITIGGIYNHFSGKDEIFEEVVLEYHPINIIFPMFEQIEDDTFEGSVRKAAKLIFEQVNKQKSFFNLFYIELVEFKGKHVIRLIKNLFPMGLEFIKILKSKKGEVKPIPTHTMLVSFLGIDPKSVKLTVPRKLDAWKDAMTNVFRELRRVLKPGGHVAFEVGEVHGGKTKLEEHVLPCGVEAGLEPVLVLINDQKFTKTANCWGVDNHFKGTNTNRIVLFRKP